MTAGSRGIRRGEATSAAFSHDSDCRTEQPKAGREKGQTDKSGRGLEQSTTLRQRLAVAERASTGRRRGIRQVPHALSLNARSQQNEYEGHGTPQPSCRQA